MSIDGNRYSVPFGLISQSVEVDACRRPLADLPSRATGHEHPVLAGRARLSVYPEHGPQHAAAQRPATLLGRYRRGHGIAAIKERMKSKSAIWRSTTPCSRTDR
ncbi:MAG: hypothetical protein U1E96_11955 [Azonexus sp.]